MKKVILKKLSDIKKVAESTGMEGCLTLEFTDCSINEWDNIINGIDEYPRYNHFVNLTPKLTVTLLLG